jgi:hypothetical protein
LPRGVEDLLFALLAKVPADRPASAPDVVSALAPFRAATTTGHGRRSSQPARSALRSEAIHRATTAAGLSERARSRGRDDGPPPGGSPPLAARPAPAAASRLDTAQLVLGATAPRREVPTWLALVAILVVSAGAGLGTYAARLRASGLGGAVHVAPPPPPTAAASERASTGVARAGETTSRGR